MKPEWLRSLKKGLIAAFAISIFFSFFENSDIGDKIDSHVAHRLNFSIREKLGRQPKIDPRIKIFAIDDLSAAYMKSHELPFRHWQELLQSLGERKPKAIFIDKIFGLAKSEGESQEVVKGLSDRPPVYVGAFTSKEQIIGRWEYPYIDDPRNNIAAFMPNEAAGLDINTLSWLDIEGLYVYGPEQSYLSTFAGVGLLDYAHDGYVRPIRRIDSAHIIPYLAFSSSEVKLHKDGLIVNNHLVEFDHRGRILANMIPANDAYARTYQFKNMLVQVEKHQRIRQVNPGDTVVLLPLMYTGNSDLFETPAGLMPGGFIVMSIINSTLTGQWLKPVGSAYVLIFLVAFLTAIVANALSLAFAFIASIILIPLLVLASGTLLFAYGGFIVPWMYASVAGALTGLYIFYENSRAAEIRTRQLKLALGRAVPPAMLKEIIRDPGSLEMRPTSDIVSVMFIDIAGFSLTSEKQDARTVFSGLKEFNSLVRRLVHEHGGVVDKALGDGVLSYFGHSFHQPRNTNFGARNHAELALECAIRIQEENIDRCLRNIGAGEAVRPLRIGINTASVYIGNLGDENKIEFTIVGDGVNYAKRLEEGCEIFRILIGRETKQLIASDSDIAKKLEPRLLKIKHHEETQVEAFEYDPFTSNSWLVRDALKAYQDSLGFVRINPRWEISEGGFIGIKFERGEGKLTSYSEDGFSMDSEHYFARGVDLTLSLIDESSSLFESTSRERLFPMLVEVRWGKKIGAKRFAHGLRIKSVNKAQKMILLKILSEALKSHPAGSHPLV